MLSRRWRSFVYTSRASSGEWYPDWVKDRVVISVRNVGYVRSAGDIMKKLYDDIGSAGGHRAMAKAVIPLDRFKERVMAR